MTRTATALLRVACSGAVAVIGCLVAGAASAELVPADSAFGTGTLTHDTQTGLDWLDLTISIQHSYVDVLAELEPAGTFEGYRLATGDEVATLFEHAGADPTQIGDFVPQNYAPALALADLMGQLASNGSCGQGCSFFFSQGWIDNGAQPDVFLSVAEWAWFDNSAPLSINYPQAPIGRFSFASTTDHASSSTAAWLVVDTPEPDAHAIGASAAVALAALRSRRRGRR